MAFDSAEKRFSAIHLTKRSGPPVPKNSVDYASRLHFIGVFSNYGATPTQASYFWRNRNLVSSVWQGRNTPQDGSTQTI